VSVIDLSTRIRIVSSTLRFVAAYTCTSWYFVCRNSLNVSSELVRGANSSRTPSELHFSLQLGANHVIFIVPNHLVLVLVVRRTCSFTKVRCYFLVAVAVTWYK
jgi:hypothetical protein